MIPIVSASLGGLSCILKLVLGVAGAAAIGLGGSCALGELTAGAGAERELAMVRAAQEEEREARGLIEDALGASRAAASSAVEGWEDEAAAHAAARRALAAAIERHKAEVVGIVARHETELAEASAAAADPAPGICRPGCALPDELRSIVEGQP